MSKKEKQVQELPKPVIKTDTTRLTVVITEDSHNGISIETNAISVETQQPVIMRQSHIIGQLISAAMFLSIDHYQILGGKGK